MEQIKEKTEDLKQIDMYNIERFVYEHGVYKLDAKLLLESNNFRFNLASKNVINYFSNALDYGHYDLINTHLINHFKHFIVFRINDLLFSKLTVLMHQKLGGITHLLYEIMYNENTQYNANKLFNSLYKYDEYFTTRFSEIEQFYIEMITLKNNYKSHI